MSGNNIKKKKQKQTKIMTRERRQIDFLFVVSDVCDVMCAKWCDGWLDDGILVPCLATYYSATTWFTQIHACVSVTTEQEGVTNVNMSSKSSSSPACQHICLLWVPTSWDTSLLVGVLVVFSVKQHNPPLFARHSHILSTWLQLASKHSLKHENVMPMAQGWHGESKSKRMGKIYNKSWFITNNLL